MDSGIYDKLESINILLLESPISTYLIWSNIFRIIHLLKTGYCVIPIEIRNDVIEKLNIVIIKLNSIMHVNERFFGRIESLHSYDKTYNDVIFINWQCLECGMSWSSFKVIHSDIISPHTCKKCSGVNINRVKKSLTQRIMSCWFTK
jgi:hypothetical protein